jgi:hypothetical protein
MAPAINQDGGDSLERLIPTEAPDVQLRRLTSRQGDRLAPITARTLDAEIVKLRDVAHVTSILVTHQLQSGVPGDTHDDFQGPPRYRQPCDWSRSIDGPLSERVLLPRNA